MACHGKLTGEHRRKLSESGKLWWELVWGVGDGKSNT